MRVEEEGVEELVIVDEEVDVQPEGVGEDYLGELGDAVAAGGCCHSARLLDHLVPCHQLAQEIQVRLVRPLLALLLKCQVLLQHEAH